MIVTRRYRSLLPGAFLLGAAVVLFPATTLDPGVDARSTAAIPKAGMNESAPLIGALKSGLDALAAHDIDGARAIRDTLPKGSLDRHVLTWTIALRGGDKVPSSEIAATVRLLPDWPGIATLRRNGERALYRENPDAQTVLQAFGGVQPQTFEGVALLARAYVALGNSKAAQTVLSPFWRTEKLGARDEAAILTEFGAIMGDEELIAAAETEAFSKWPVKQQRRLQRLWADKARESDMAHRYQYSARQHGEGYIKKIEVGYIYVAPGRRDLNSDRVRDIAASIKEIGILSPPIVTFRDGLVIDGDEIDGVPVLVAGRHRLEAMKALGPWHECERYCRTRMSWGFDMYPAFRSCQLSAISMRSPHHHHLTTSPLPSARLRAGNGNRRMQRDLIQHPS